jgi:hypothetical protein
LVAAGEPVAEGVAVIAGGPDIIGVGEGSANAAWACWNATLVNATVGRRAQIASDDAVSRGLARRRDRAELRRDSSAREEYVPLRLLVNARTLR